MPATTLYAAVVVAGCALLACARPRAAAPAGKGDVELPKRGSSRLSFSSFRRTPDTFSAQSPMHTKKKKKNPPGANV